MKFLKTIILLQEVALGRWKASCISNDSWKLRLGAALGVVSLILASEKVSFSKVIAANPALNWLDQLWRRPL